MSVDGAIDAVLDTGLHPCGRLLRMTSSYLNQGFQCIYLAWGVRRTDMRGQWLNLPQRSQGRLTVSLCHVQLRQEQPAVEENIGQTPLAAQRQPGLEVLV